MSGPQQPIQVTQAVRDALARKDVIGGIKVLRDANPHLGLRDLKVLAERFLRDGLDPSAAGAPAGGPPAKEGDWPAEVDAAIARGALIEAIKRLRDARGISLRDAKVLVERRAGELAPGDVSGSTPRPSVVPSIRTVAPGDGGSSGMRWLVPVVLVVLVAALWSWFAAT